MEFRRLGEVFGLGRFWVRSRIAPAVLGLDSEGSRVEVLDKGTSSMGPGLFRPLARAPERIDEMLPEIACPGRTVIVLDVSVETNDNGLGMNSRVSENPTRALLLGLFCLGLPSGEELGDGFEASSGTSGS